MQKYYTTAIRDTDYPLSAPVYLASEVDACMETARAFIARRPCYCRGLGDGEGVTCARCEALDLLTPGL